MKRSFEIIPFFVVAIIIAILIGLFSAGAFDDAKKTEITSATLIEVIDTAKLSTAKFIQHGIAKSIITGKDDCFILYYATVRLNVDFTEISFDIDNDAKTVKAILPKEFGFDVDLFKDEEHKFRYYPDSGDRTLKEIEYICKKDAKEKAEANSALINTAKESLKNTVKALLEPILSTNGYTFIDE